VKNYLLWIRYDGTEFHGWQRQTNARSVQGELEAALAVMLGHDFRLGSSSRTDAGVHARNHPVSLSTNSNIPQDGIQKGLNSLLPRDMAIVLIQETPPGFSARKRSIGKSYLYRVLESLAPDPFEARYSWRIKQKLDLAAMQAGAKLLRGEHDFSAFRSSQCDCRTTRRFVSSVHVERNGRVITIAVSGNAFLRNMVRIIAGSLVEVGTRRHPPAWIGEVLESRDRTMAGITAPAMGLCLRSVYFPTEVLCSGAHEW